MKEHTGKIILALSVVVFVALGLIFARFSIDYVKRNVRNVLFENGTSISRTVIESSTELFNLQRESEKNIENRLYRLAIRIDGPIEKSIVESLIDEGFHYVALFEENTLIAESPVRDSYSKHFQSITNDILFRTNGDELIFGVDPDFPASDMPKGIALRRGNRILVVFISPDDIQTDSGLGYLVRNIAQEPGISYVVLQNEGGVILASRGVRRMSGISSDKKIQKALRENISIGRFIDFEDQQVFEVITPFPKMGEFEGVLRIAFPLEEYNAVVTAIIIPVLIIFIVMFVAFYTLFYNLFLRRRLRKAEMMSEGLRTRSGTLYFEISPKGMIRRANQPARKLFAVAGLQSTPKAEDIIGISNWKKLCDKQTLILPGVRIGNRMLNIFIENTGIGAGYYAFAEDMTELYDLRRRTEELHHLEGLSELTSTIAHDIRNPLNAISIGSQKLSIICEDNDKASKIVNTMTHEISELNKMIDEFLSLSRPISIETNEIDLDLFFNQLVDSSRPYAVQRGIDISAESMLENARGHIDSSRLSRAIGNIVKNAIEASKGDNVVMKALIDNNNFVIEVQNIGETISAEVIENLFRPVASKKSGGYGLGLFSAYRIIKTHHGDIKVDSQNGFTRFRISVPL
jgi:signal transduction histidine kinase